MHLLSINGAIGTVSAVQFAPEVASDHTFAVGQDQWVVRIHCEL
jgi:hypothetical protein